MAGFPCFLRLNKILLCVYLATSLSVAEQLGSFHVSFVNNAAVSMGVQVCFHVSIKLHFLLTLGSQRL